MTPEMQAFALFLADPFWRGVFVAIVVIGVIEILVTVAYRLWWLNRGWQNVADRLWERFIELEEQEAAEVEKEFSFTEHLAPPRPGKTGEVLVQSRDRLEWSEPVQGPQERPEPEGVDQEAQDVHEAPSEPIRPRFGVPVEEVYDPADYVEPLRCSIESGRCGGDLLIAGEAFYRIPDPFDPDGEFVVVCKDDVLWREQVKA